MIKNHLKVAWRNLWNNRFYTLLNVTGLAIGLAVSLALMLYVNGELSFDKYHENADRIYRAGLDVTYDDTKEKWATAPNIAGPVFTDEINGIESYTRFLRHSFGRTAFLSVDNQNFAETDLYWVDSTVFDVFDITLLQGDPKTAFAGPNKVLLSEETAEIMFGRRNPMGKIIKLDNARDLEVTGIFKDFPKNSSLDCKIMASFMTQDWAAKNLYWSNCSFETYFLLRDGVDPADVTKQMASSLDRHVEKDNQWFAFWLQPFLDMHLYSEGIAMGYSAQMGDIRHVQLLSILALAVLLLACFNYINMATARSQQRFREVGINKTLGASTGQMIRRFYVETGILVAASLILGLVLVEVSLPLFESVSGKELSITSLLTAKWFWTIPGIWALVTFGAGLYPALFLSSFTPSKLLSPVQTGSGGSKFFRRTLVIGQFTVCVALIIGAIVFNNQLEFISNKKLGFEPEQVVAITASGAEKHSQIRSFATSCNQLPSVSSACLAQAFPGVDPSGYTMSRPGNQDQFTSVGSNWVEGPIIETLGLQLVAGKALSAKSKDDTTIQVLMNEAGIEFLGYTADDAIGKSLPSIFNGRPTTIAGVVEDFHFNSMHSPITPYVFTNGNKLSWASYVLVKLQAGNLRESLRQLEDNFQMHVPTSAFEFTFLDAHVDNLYKAEQRLARVVLIFTILTIFISCLGLFGLAAFTAERRTKEIGIRKVLGASMGGLVGLLSRDFIMPVMQAVLLAAPIAWFGLNKWLQNFAYRIDVEWWHIAVAGVLAVVIAFVTVSVQSIRSAVANPIESLRSE